MENERYDREDLDRAVEAIRNGGIILYPTDTVWGIGCDAANVDAVEKIYRLKERSDSKAMLCLVDSRRDAPKVGTDRTGRRVMATHRGCCQPADNHI